MPLESGQRFFDFRQAPRGSIAVGLPQPCAQNMLATEGIQRQITVAVIVAMEEPSFLLAVQRQIGCVHVQDDLFRRPCVRLDKHADQQLVDAVLPEGDLLVSILLASAEFQPVQRALACQRFVPFFPVGQDTEQRVVAQLLGIVQVFLAQRNPYTR